MRYIKIVVILFIIYPSGVYSSNYNTRVKEVAEKLNVNYNSAERILISVAQIIRNAQFSIEKIADSDVSFNEKITYNGLIDSTLARYFQSDNSTIQVTSLNRSYPVSRKAREYFEGLARLSYSGKYIRVKLHFYPDYMKVGRISSYTNTSYIFSVDTFQKFSGCTTYEYCYEDVTKKQFSVILKKTGSNVNSYEVVINSISATDTMTFDDFERLKQSIR